MQRRHLVRAREVRNGLRLSVPAPGEPPPPKHTVQESLGLVPPWAASRLSSWRLTSAVLLENSVERREHERCHGLTGSEGARSWQCRRRRVAVLR